MGVGCNLLVSAALAGQLGGILGASGHWWPVGRTEATGH